jgi:hypothetical protein
MLSEEAFVDADFLRDILLVLAGVLVGNLVFNNFEKHLPWTRRIVKHGVLWLVLVGVRALLGGWGLVVALALLTAGQIVLHAWWFPKNGVNGLTAEPHEVYLALISKMKNKGRDS